MQKIILTLIFILLGLGFMPFKFPRDADKIADNELLLHHEESTCVSDFGISKGKLNVPADLKHYFNEPVYELTIKGSSPFDVINDNQSNWHLISENEFVVSGKVIGVDSIYKKECGKFAFYQIDEWAPTTYQANFWTFSRPIFIAYFLTLFACVITSIVLFITHRLKKNKT